MDAASGVTTPVRETKFPKSVPIIPTPMNNVKAGHR
jgi:hypothetical protein